jgi:cobalt-zinc-cadmium efflux system protein
MADCSTILEAIQTALWDRFHIAHTTIQFETTGCETTHGCCVPPAPDAELAHAHDHSHAGHVH